MTKFQARAMGERKQNQEWESKNITVLSDSFGFVDFG